MTAFFIIRVKLKKEAKMPMCGFNPKMLKGLTLFAQGLYEQVLEKSKEDGVSIERALEIEVEEMNIFLTTLDEKYYKELRPTHSVDEAMKKLVDWTKERFG